MSADERVALYDELGAVVGAATRSRVRAQNLRHGATAVVVRDGLGRVYVHRRTRTKDVYAGLLDFAAGGVLQAGEHPRGGALREVQEELGVAGVALKTVGQDDYRDEASTYRAFRYTTTYDGPIRWQPEEVSWGDWFTVGALCRLIAQTPDAFVPDSRALWVTQLLAWNEDRFLLEGGWDNITSVVEGRWVDRTPRRDELAPSLLAETRLLPAIVDRVPLEVPVPIVVERDPLVIRHRLVHGAACEPSALTQQDGRDVGVFLHALHGLPDSITTAASVRSAADDRPARAELVAGFRSMVLPRLPPSLVIGAGRLLDAVAEVGEQRLCHGDLTGEHVLVRGGRVRGVIDWGDARVTDPALDLAWLIHGTNEAFARQLISSYEAGPDEVVRAAAWFALMPWHGLSRALTLGDHAGSRRLWPVVTAALRRWSTTV